jgi:hypothetical protein
LVSDKPLIFQMRVLCVKLFYEAVIFDLLTLTLEIDYDGYLWNLILCMRTFVFHNIFCLISIFKFNMFYIIWASSQIFFFFTNHGWFIILCPSYMYYLNNSELYFVMIQGRTKDFFKGGFPPLIVIFKGRVLRLILVLKGVSTHIISFILAIFSDEMGTYLRNLERPL